MVTFVVGCIVGGVVVGAVSYVYAAGRLELARADLGYLRGRLLSLVRLTESGLLKPESIEAANVLTQVHELVLGGDEHGAPPRGAPARELSVQSSRFKV